MQNKNALQQLALLYTLAAMHDDILQRMQQQRGYTKLHDNYNDTFTQVEQLERHCLRAIVAVTHYKKEYLEDVVIQLHFSCDVGDYSTTDTQYAYLLLHANISELIKQVKRTYEMQ